MALPGRNQMAPADLLRMAGLLSRRPIPNGSTWVSRPTRGAQRTPTYCCYDHYNDRYRRSNKYLNNSIKEFSYEGESSCHDEQQWATRKHIYDTESYHFSCGIMHDKQYSSISSDVSSTRSHIKCRWVLLAWLWDLEVIPKCRVEAQGAYT